jgi:hypothetical protein
MHNTTIISITCSSSFIILTITTTTTTSTIIITMTIIQAFSSPNGKRSAGYGARI